MAQVVAVHGIGKRTLGEESLRQQWLLRNDSLALADRTDGLAESHVAIMCINLSLFGLTEESADFLNNPRHEIRLPYVKYVKLKFQNAAEFDEYARHRDTDFTGRPSVCAMGHHGSAMQYCAQPER
ncbi:hypothetical protein ACIOG4_38915 [Streptomyces microflavus]|uniref:hypothetical protein n=1 Tax=Streptomyces microflavus TaxID=1919 RepID=UPI0037F86ECE